MKPRQWPQALLFAAMCLCAAPLPAQTIVYVNAAAPTDGDGTSWATARKYLNPALADAAAFANAGHTVQVWIAAGIYLPDQSPPNPAGGTVDDAYFPLHNAVSLFGGFTGIETSLDQADPTANYTGLHGFNGDGTGAVQGSLRVIVGSSVNSSVLVDGIAVTNPRYLGGGGKAIRLTGSSPTFRRCIIHDMRNNGTHAPTVYTAGGSPLFENCTFQNNRAGAPDAHGGAIYCETGALTIRKCLFESNRADGMGGAIYQKPDSGPVLVEDCVFRDNYTNDMWGGAMWLASDSIVRRCTFERNSSRYSVGALGTAGLVEDSLFIGNSATTHAGAAAGGRYVNCVFRGNRADFGGVFAGAPTCTNCIFVANGARRGGVNYGGGTFANCTFSQNSCEGTSGIINSVENIPVTVINCTFSANGAIDIRCGFAPLTIRNTVFYKTALATPGEFNHITSLAAASVEHSYLQGLGVTFSGHGNIGGSPFMSPRFADPDGPDDIPGTLDDDFRLLPGSPCIDAGDSSALPPDILTDLAGNPRFFDDPGMPDAGSLTAPVVDMGAYEFQGTSCLADFNGDGFIDALDLDLFTNLFEIGDRAADLNRDIFTDAIDYDLFHNALEAGCP